MVLLTTTEIAERLEEVDVIHLTRQVEICREIFPQHEVLAHRIDHGVAAVTLPLFGRKLNHVVGFGMGGSVSTQDLVTIEGLYSDKNVSAEIDLCSHAHPTALQVLASNGYAANGWLNNYVRILTDNDLQDQVVPGIEIARVSSESFDEFIRCSVAGFKDNGRPELLLETLARIATSRSDTTLYFAMIDGKIAGSGGMAKIETSTGKVAHFYIDSTLPEYRGRGIQSALIRARVSDARRAGFDLASVGVRPGTGSARNIERSGFALAYVKASFLRANK